MEFQPFPEQRLAIEAGLGPVLVVAGPGAGKTFCLISRVRYLIEDKGLAPGRICAVTFTNKAAEEITARLHRALGHKAEEITRGTLHALCLAILREHVDEAGLRRGFGVADEDYQRIVLRRLGVPPKERSALLTLFSRRRLQHYPLTPRHERLHRDYTAHLVRRNLVDFDDLIARTADLFERRPEIADAVAGRWDYLLVDEFQDLNPVQYEILKRLAGGHRNFFAVGDDEQSIFSWTGADPRVLVRFREDFGVAEPIVLDKNCRCSRQIFETARRLLAENPQLFDKQLSADRESAHDVRAFGFPDEDAEAAWLLADLQRDQAASGLGWGDYAMLYRQHHVGDHLEGRLLRAGIPCRLARGRSIAEDAVVGYVIAALRVMRSSADPVAVEAFAKVVFSEHLLQDLLGAAGEGGDILAAARALARSRHAGDPDTKRVWRFIYQVENLAALYRAHTSLAALVDELLSQSVGPYRNALEERDDELIDPADLPDAVRLAERLQAAIAAERPIVIEPQSGLEIALRGMLIGAGVRHVPLPAEPAAGGESLVLRAADGGALGLALACFKALQLVHARALDEGLTRFVTFDLETTDQDPATCEIVEIAAARVVDGEIVARFHTLVRPTRPIAPRAQQVHGYDESALRDAPPFADVWPRFRDFVERDVLVAHNGQSFDVPVLRRLAAGQPGLDDLVFFDTLPLARALFPGSAKLADLAARFGIDAGRAHHALDDAVALVGVFRELRRQRLARARKAVLVNVLDFLGLALALEAGEREGERRVLFDLARFYTLGRYSDALEFYAAGRERGGATGPSVEELVERLGGKRLMERLRAEPDPAQRYPAAVARLRALIAADTAATLVEAVDRLLERVALSTSREAEVDAHRVNLLTLHSTKGLEFSRVYVVGVEDFQIPGYYQVVDNREDEIQEARRLLYVGMTRARDRLILTYTAQRVGRASGEHRFLDEMRITPG
ncbi:MAG: UvrD-helicase domain-containing protein [Gemmatimonadales bacterium]